MQRDFPSGQDYHTISNSWKAPSAPSSSPLRGTRGVSLPDAPCGLQKELDLNKPPSPTGSSDLATAGNPSAAAEKDAFFRQDSAA